ncbi:succinate dehydrogenase assembly factor 2 [Magnetovibrio sp.]|uniref:FAD assembly factor SdhE n=1 Tax=Magnetovibrio sp. TaxID=2024836 RepID=UPI002F92BEE9
MAEPLDSTRKRLLFHCTHMGMKENDVMFGAFAEAHLADLTDAEVKELEALLKNNDMDLFKWVMGQAEVPRTWDTALMKRLQDFNQTRNRHG